ncbi:DsrE/DsrF-like family protein [Flavobacteriaceae bacterium MAR_2010_188]|nr:DsrE/DsrF-like family protein [Flavobacteriaceae bacterium MAR_2010_188]
MKTLSSLIFILLISTSMSYSQDTRTDGIIIPEFGKTFNVEDKDVAVDTTQNMSVIFDISSSADDRNVMNKLIETAARFLNMHAAAGFKKEQLNVAMVIHGGAWQDILKDEFYQAKFGMPNPNTKLIKALSDAGVDIILCGQTAGFREIDKDELNENVKMALSAMTTLIQYDKKGYTILKL